MFIRVENEIQVITSNIIIHVGTNKEMWLLGAERATIETHKVNADGKKCCRCAGDGVATGDLKKDQRRR
jgi:hypothetical protein